MIIKIQFPNWQVMCHVGLNYTGLHRWDYSKLFFVTGPDFSVELKIHCLGCQENRMYPI